jgi:lysine biosynthesis protein LysW
MEPNLTATCPSCQTKIRLNKKPFVGFFFFCDECDAELEVVELNPVVVSEVVEEYEDFDDDSTDDDYVYVDDDEYDYDDDEFDE